MSTDVNIENVNQVYFLGIGGIGMSALARYFLSTGCNVVGYDKTRTALTHQLEKEGADIHYEENIDAIPTSIKQQKENTLVIYTPAIPKEHLEFQFFIKNDIPYFKRSEVLGLISQNYFTIAIAGTHGKTTTSSILAHLLNESGIDCVAFLGGVSLNFSSNFLMNKEAKTMVVEADEFDRSFLTLHPDIALITSLDADHLDIYGNKNEMTNAYQEFVKKIKKDGVLITKQEYLAPLNGSDSIQYKSYAIHQDADYQGTSVRIEKGNYFLDILSEGRETKNIQLGLPGIHNVENALGAIAIASQLGVNIEQIKKALATYKGVKRRFEYHIKTDGFVYIDDYAHHPTELEVCIQSVKELYPAKKITGIFQPHLFSRTKDFKDEFIKSLSRLDELILLDIYPARELPIEGITSKILLDQITCESKVLLKNEELIEHIRLNNYEVLLTLGAGDIDVFVPQIKELKSKHINV